jgi:uncharacterized RDD family membrane protein YckC/Tfp pilus assembly major pilin PilA
MYCANCGKQVGQDQKFCAACGSANISVNETNPFVPPRAPLHATGGVVPYAGFWWRVLGWLIDYVILVVCIGVVAAVTGSNKGAQSVALAMFYFVVPLFYTVLMESSRLQGTLGKLAVGIKVTDLAGNRISIGRALGRFCGHIIDALTLGIGYGMAGFTERRQTLHDMIAGTLVVHRDFVPDSIRDAAPAPTSALRTVLIVIGILLFGPFSLGIVAAIAIPAYQNYTIRAQVMEGLVAAGTLKAAVEQAAIQGANWAKIDSQSLGIQQPQGLKYVQTLRVESGAVIIEYGGQANAKIRGGRLVIIPGLTSSQELVWVCGRAEIPESAKMAIAEGAKYTNVPNAYLPMSCRAPG